MGLRAGGQAHWESTRGGRTLGRPRSNGRNHFHPIPPPSKKDTLGSLMYKFHPARRLAETWHVDASQTSDHQLEFMFIFAVQDATQLAPRVGRLGASATVGVHALLTPKVLSQLSNQTEFHHNSTSIRHEKTCPTSHHPQNSPNTFKFNSKN